MLRPNNKSLLKNRNKTLVLRALQIKPGTPRQELSEITGLSFPTVSKIVQNLLDEGIVCEAGVLESTGGRRPDLLAVNPRYCNIFGMDIELDYICMTVTDFCYGRIVSEVVEKNIMEMSNEEINNHIRNITRKFYEKNKEVFQAVRFAGIGLCGYSDLLGNVVASSTYYFNKLDIRGAIPVDVPCFVENNANAAALREQAIGLAHDKTNFVCILMGKTGVASGVVIDGRLFTGHNGRAGEFGTSRLLWPDLVWNNPGMDTFIKLSSRVAGLSYQLFDPERIYICGDLEGHVGLLREELAKVFALYNKAMGENPPVDIVDTGMYGVAVGATVHARQCFLGGVEFASDAELWKKMALSA